MSDLEETPWWTDEPIDNWWAVWDSDDLRGAGNVYAPASVRIHVQNWRGYDVALTAVPTPHGFTCAEISIAGKDRPVDYDALRSVPITELLRPATESLYYCIPPSVLVFWRPGTEMTEDVQSFMKDKSARMLYMAGIYDLARFGGLAPREAVQDLFKVSRATSTRMISTARKEGLIKDEPPTLKAAPPEVLEVIAGGPSSAGNPPTRKVA